MFTAQLGTNDSRLGNIVLGSRAISALIDPTAIALRADSSSLDALTLAASMPELLSLEGSRGNA